MERDFLGLVTNNSSPVIKHHLHHPHIHHHRHHSGTAVTERGSGIKWYFPDSVLNSPPAAFSKSHLEEKPMRSILDSSPSPRVVTKSTKDGYIQRNMIGSQSGLASSPYEQSGARHVHHPERFMLHSFANNQRETTLPATNYRVPQAHIFAIEHHMDRSTSNSPSFSSVPPMSPASRVPSPTLFPTYTDTRRGSKPISAPAQMTTFYAGSVNVYDNIAPEKAQAIMLLAGNETPSTPASMVSIENTSHGTSSSGLVNHVTIFSQLASQSGVVSNQIATTSSQQQQLPESSLRAGYSQRSSTGYASPGPVPQARKASLARFLERRKERVTNSQPYSMELKSAEQERDKSSSASYGLSFTLRSPS